MNVAFGISFNNDEDCQIIDPLSSPVIFPAGTSQLAIQIVFDVERVSDWGINLDLGEGAGLVVQNCNKYTILNGAAVQSQSDATITRTDGEPFETGSYVLVVTVNGRPIQFPFKIA